MIDSLVKLLEKLIDLLNMRKEGEAKALDLLVTPIFTDLKAVHQDYLRMFEKCHHDLQKGTDLQHIAETLMSDRLELEAVRHAIIGFIHSYCENPKLEKCQDFFRSVWGYLYTYDLTHNVSDTRSHILLKELERWVREGHEGPFKPSREVSPCNPREVLVQVTERELHALRDGWEDLSKEYAKLISGN